MFACLRPLRVFAAMAAIPLLFACTQLKDDPPKAEPKKETHVGKFTRELLNGDDVRRDHPDWVVVDPDVDALDPWTQSYMVYDSATHDIAMLNFQNWKQQFPLLNDDREPTFADVERFVKQESAGLPMVRPYKHWVYDPMSGELVQMLDKVHRDKVYKEKGIPIPED